MKKDPNRELAKQRLNMGKEPGGSYADLNNKYERQQHANQVQKNSRGGGGRPSCFTGNTMVLTPNGWKRIDEFRRNDIVLSYSLGKKSLMEREVLRVKRHKSLSRVWEMRFSLSKEVVQTTSTHSFLTQRGWVKTKNLVLGDNTLYIDDAGNLVNQNVVSVTATEEYSETFNLVTTRDNNFIVQGAIAHNFTHLRLLRSLITNIGNELASELSFVSDQKTEQAIP